MTTSLLPPIAPGKTGAWVCLLAALLLWSPTWAAAWHANRMECCDGVMCPAHSHRAGTPSRNAITQAATKAEDASSMECHRAASSPSMQCFMSCCHETQHVFAASVLFVIPMQTQLLPAKVASEGLRASAAGPEFALFEPLSPPPRQLSASLQ